MSHSIANIYLTFLTIWPKVGICIGVGTESIPVKSGSKLWKSFFFFFTHVCSLDCLLLNILLDANMSLAKGSTLKLWYFYGFYIPSKLLQVTIEQFNFGLLSIPKKGKMKEVITCTSAPKIILKTKAWTFSLNWLTDTISSYTQVAPLLYWSKRPTTSTTACLAWNG